MEPSKQQVPQVEGQLSGVEVPSKEAEPEGTEQLNQPQPAKQVETLPVLNKPDVGVPKVEAQPVQNTAPVENEEQTRDRFGKILDNELDNAYSLQKLVGDTQDKK